MIKKLAFCVILISVKACFRTWYSAYSEILKIMAKEEHPFIAHYLNINRSENNLRGVISDSSYLQNRLSTQLSFIQIQCSDGMNPNLVIL